MIILGDIFVELFDLLLFHHDSIDGCWFNFFDICHKFLVFLG